MLSGKDFEGGHFASRGISEGREPIAVPVHRHEVSLDYTRIELELQYTVTANWDLIARIPWEQKAQTSSVVTVAPITEREHEAMQRNMNLHHRSETYEGVSDLMFLAQRRVSRTEDELLTLGLGLTAPTGRTEENPFRLGEAGVEHLHIQFGTGTVDPLLEAGYRRRIGQRVTAGGYLAARLPLYENDRGFQGPPEVTAVVTASHRLLEIVSVRGELGAFYQDFAYWDGVRDENTGLVSTVAGIGTSIVLRKLMIGVDLRFPISQRTLTEGDAFEQGPTILINLSGVAPWVDRKSIHSERR